MFLKTNISNPLIWTGMFMYQGVRNVSFLENFAYIRDVWPLSLQKANLLDEELNGVGAKNQLRKKTLLNKFVEAL